MSQKRIRKVFDERAILTMLAAGLPKREISAQTGASPRTIGRIAAGTRRGNHSRCPGCGGLQTVPCLVCTNLAPSS